MKTVTERALRELVGSKGEWYVSIYMPTHPFGREGIQDVPRLKKLVSAAEKQLVERGVRGVAARGFLKAILALPDQNDWNHRSRGLAMFCSGEVLVAYKSDAVFEERLNVGRRFHIKQLLPAIGEPLEFLVLALSRNSVRLLEATSSGFRRLQPTGLPSGIGSHQAACDCRS
jgi:hypothetical protein